MAIVTRSAYVLVRHTLLLLVLQSWLTSSLMVLYTYSHVYIEVDTSGSVEVGRYPADAELQGTLMGNQGHEVLRVLTRRLRLLSPGGIPVTETGYQLDAELPDFVFDQTEHRYTDVLGVGTQQQRMDLTWEAGGLELSLTTHLVTRPGHLSRDGLFPARPVTRGQVLLLGTASHSYSDTCTLCWIAKYLQVDLIIQGHQLDDDPEVNAMPRACADLLIRYDHGAAMELSNKVLVNDVMHEAEVNHTTGSRGTRVSLTFERRNSTTHFGLLLTPGEYVDRSLTHYDTPEEEPLYYYEYNKDYYDYESDGDLTDIESTDQEFTTAKTEPQPQQSMDGVSSGGGTPQLCLAAGLCALLIKITLHLGHFHGDRL